MLRTLEPWEEPQRGAARPQAAPAELPPGAGLSMAGLVRQSPAARAAGVAGDRRALARMPDWVAENQFLLHQREENVAEAVRIDLGSASDGERLAEVERLLGEPGAPTPMDDDVAAIAIDRVWQSFGARLWEVALEHRELFARSQNRTTITYVDANWQGLRQRFKDAVEGRARANLDANAAFVTKEIDSLGLGDEVGQGDARADRDRGLREMQIRAGRVAEAKDAMSRCLEIPVGQIITSDAAGGLESSTALFDPRVRPEVALGPDIQDWDAVKLVYDKLDAYVKQAIAESPASFVLSEAGAAAGHGFAGDDAEDARARLRPLMAELLGKIDAARGLIGDDLDYREMHPIHDQLFATAEWSGSIERAVIETALRKYEHHKLLRSLGLSAISALGFLFSSFATGGASIFIGAAVGVAASGAQAGLSIEDYYDKAKARAARTGDPELDLMSQESVDSAKVQAILDTALAAVDLFGGAGAIRRLASPALALGKAGEAGARASAEAILKSGLTAATPVATVERAVLELGAENAAKASGLSLEQLGRLLPAEGEASRRLLAAAAAAKAGTVVPEALVKRLAAFATLDRAAAAAVMREGIDSIGMVGAVEAAGGWKLVTKQLGEGHAIVTELEAWRTQIVQEGIDYVKTASKGDSSAVRTGTIQGTSDVDASTFGRDAAQNVDRMKEFMARRTGVPRNRLELILDADAAVNPSRMHLQDIAPNLSEATHAEIGATFARHQEALLFARRYHDALLAGDVLLMERLDKMAEEIGLGTINKGWAPMEASTISALERELDGWANELATLERAGADEAARRPLMEKIGKGQAELLANNPNMYLDSGNIKTLVTRRPIDQEKIEAALGSLDQANLARLDTVFTHERYLKVLGEGPSIDHALKLLSVAEEPAEIAAALKAFAKHGERVVDAIGADVAHGVDPAAWAAMDQEFGRLMKAAKSGELIDEVAARLPELQERVAAEAAHLEAGMVNATRALREQAGLGTALTAEQAAGISAWASAEASARLQLEALVKSLELLHLGMATGRVGADAIDAAAAQYPFTPAEVLWRPDLVGAPSGG